MFKKILVPVDLQKSKYAAKAMQIAVEEAKKHGASLHVITVVPGFGTPLVASFFPEKAFKEAMREVSKELKAYVTKHVPDDVPVKLTIAEGNPYEKIIREANKVNADLIVIPSTNRKKMEQLVLGSCTSKVVQHAGCSVMIVRT